MEYLECFEGFFYILKIWVSFGHGRAYFSNSRGDTLLFPLSLNLTPAPFRFLFNVWFKDEQLRSESSSIRIWKGLVS